MDRTATEKERLAAFGLRVKVLRVQAQMIQDELAAKAGLHRTFVGLIERGECTVNSLALWPLAEALGVSVADLFCDVHGTPIP